MEYEVQVVPVDKAIVTPEGFLEPLCTTCCSADCTNPIQEMTISIAGVVKKHRLWVERAGIVRQVASCKGYIGDAIQPLGY